MASLLVLRYYYYRYILSKSFFPAVLLAPLELFLPQKVLVRADNVALRLWFACVCVGGSGDPATNSYYQAPASE